jgi:hypothetical protein
MTKFYIAVPRFRIKVAVAQIHTHVRFESFGNQGKNKRQVLINNKRCQNMSKPKRNNERQSRQAQPKTQTHSNTTLTRPPCCYHYIMIRDINHTDMNHTNNINHTDIALAVMVWISQWLWHWSQASTTRSPACWAAVGNRPFTCCASAAARCCHALNN